LKLGYNKSIHKIKAREENIRIFQKLTDKKKLPRNRSYWTLCNVQSRDSGSEIIQLIEAGVITESQFVGVDRDSDIINANKTCHPKATWICGDWNEAIRSRSFNPGLVYLDTTSFADHKNAIKMLTATMLRCPEYTVVFANVMLNDPRSKRRFDPDVLLQAIQKEIPVTELQKWETKIVNYEYSMTGKTDMGTFVFYKNK